MSAMTFDPRDVRDPNNPQCYTNRRGDYKCDKNAAWWSWGRWLIFGLVVALVIIAVLIVLRISARRRLHRGERPLTGTAWIAGSVRAAAPPKDIDVESSIDGASRYGNTGYGNSPHGNQQPPAYPLRDATAPRQ